ncbi:hypothetical protein B0H16DRAFT_1500002 [Mycena metata]|uniref:F-box domain-containing protein n=1 Tax=Mycena metata TaxID=1033252 RepID=A0AAD7K985_9AGAR|nr:hypothetical protein B0H16DRAFT_1500002 [Mycena metata]
MAPAPLLPLDLLRPIFLQFSDSPKFLSLLCGVSRTFLHETLPILYADVALSSDQVLSFCGTITASPEIAPHVRRLSIQLARDFSATDELRQCMRLLSRLRALEIRPLQRGPWEETIIPSTLSNLWVQDKALLCLINCPFRLKVFWSAFDMTRWELGVFLKQQSDIEELASLDTSRRVVTLPAGTLPKLRELKISGTRLEFEMGPNEKEREFRETRMAASYSWN